MQQAYVFGAMNFGNTFNSGIKQRGIASNDHRNCSRCGRFGNHLCNVGDSLLHTQIVKVEIAVVDDRQCFERFDQGLYVWRGNRIQPTHCIRTPTGVAAAAAHVAGHADDGDIDFAGDQVFGVHRNQCATEGRYA